MSESIDIYIDTTSHESSEATEFDYELFERFMSGGPWVAHSEYMKLKNDNAKLRELVADMWPFVEGAMDDEYCPAPECPFTELCTENQVCMASSGFHYRMRELGIEVPDV